MKKLELHDRRHLEAAQGWLGLGNWQEANEELERVTPQMRAHPDVLNVRCKIYCEAQKWDYVATVADTLCRILPDSSFGPLHLAHALRRLERVAEARDVLLPLADKFPGEWRLQYQLACYCSRLGQKKEALGLA